MAKRCAISDAHRMHSRFVSATIEVKRKDDTRHDFLDGNHRIPFLLLLQPLLPFSPRIIQVIQNPHLNGNVRSIPSLIQFNVIPIRIFVVRAHKSTPYHKPNRHRQFEWHIISNERRCYTIINLKYSLHKRRRRVSLTNKIERQLLNILQTAMLKCWVISLYQCAPAYYERAYTISFSILCRIIFDGKKNTAGWKLDTMPNEMNLQYIAMLW